MTEKARSDHSWTLFLAFFVLVAAAFVTRTLLNAGTVPLLNDTDDAMRLVTVRDLLAGQGWFDNVQHRLNTPYGAELHWSRLIDLPIAGLILLLQPLAGAANAATLTAFIWPLALLFVLLLLSVILTTQLVGRRGRLAAVALPALSLITMAEFVPGRLDHHSVQILLMLGLVSATIASLEKPRFAILSGILAATALAIGTESLPTVAAAIMAFGLVWVFRPDGARALRAFGLSFAAATLLHLAIALPPDRWLTPACDALSIVYAATAAAVGLCYAGLSFLRASRLIRAAALVTAGALTVLGIILVFPACLHGPYAGLDPWLVENWLGKISEAEPVWTRLLVDPAYTLAVTVPPLLALLIVAARLMRGEPQGRAAWLVYGLFLALALVVTLVQIRAGRFATSLAVPGGALAIVWLRERYLRTQRLPAAAGLIGGWLAASGLAIFLIVTGITSLVPAAPAPLDRAVTAGKAACLMPEAFVDLAGLPPERVMTPIDLGSHMLAFTSHEVVAAPYHRNQLGVRDAFRFFTEPIDQARMILDIRGISLVVTCAAMPEMQVRPGAAPDSFVALRAAGKLPDWLVPQTLPGAALQVYAVRR